MIGFAGLATLVPLAVSGLATGVARLVPAPWASASLLAYPLSGLAAWMVWRRFDVGLERKRAALRLWGWLVLWSSLWPAALYVAHRPALALAGLGVTFLLALLTLRAFSRLQRGAAASLLPHAAWLCCSAAFLIERFWPSTF